MIKELLKELKMLGACHYYEEEKTNDLDKEQFIVALLQNEIKWKSLKRTQRRLKQAKFPYVREWAEINYKTNKNIPFKNIKKIVEDKFLQNNRNLCFIGAPGLGKTHSVISIGRELCRQGFTVKFYTAIDLVSKLEEMKADNKLSKFMENIIKPNLLIIDELGFVPFSENGARLLFDVFSKRYEKGSIAVTTNLSLPKWGETFGSIELTTALIDRFTHKSDIFVFEGESYRFTESKKNKNKS